MLTKCQPKQEIKLHIFRLILLNLGLTGQKLHTNQIRGDVARAVHLPYVCHIPRGSRHTGYPNIDPRK